MLTLSVHIYSVCHQNIECHSGTLTTLYFQKTPSVYLRPDVYQNTGSKPRRLLETRRLFGTQCLIEVLRVFKVIPTRLLVGLHLLQGITFCAYLLTVIRCLISFIAYKWPILQTQAATMRFKLAQHVTRFTKRKFVGLQQSTDVCLTTPLWLSLTTTFVNTFPALCCQTKRGLVC